MTLCIRCHLEVMLYKVLEKWYIYNASESENMIIYLNISVGKISLVPISLEESVKRRK